jgi:hypothetical protein
VPTGALKMIFDEKLPEVFYTEKVGDVTQAA